jgi:hypothetical protein
MVGILSLGSVALKGGYIYQHALIETPDTNGPISAHITDCPDPTAFPAGCSNGSGIITADINVQFPAPGHTEFNSAARATVSQSGNVGVFAEFFSGFDYNLRAEVDVTSSEFVNTTSRAQRLISNVVIDGGSFSIPISYTNDPSDDISYEYLLQSSSLSSGATYCSEGVLFDNHLHNLFELNGNDRILLDPNKPCGPDSHFVDLGAFLTQNNNIATVTIPRSFQTFDLGTLQPGETATLSYHFGYYLSLRGIAQFSDPFHLSGHPVLGTITFEPVETTTPEPGTILLVGCGLLALVIARRRYQSGE